MDRLSRKILLVSLAIPQLVCNTFFGFSVPSIFFLFLNNKIIKSSVRIVELGGSSDGHKCLSLVSITFRVRFRWRRYNAGDSGLRIRDS